jgi:8-oxo-dGTP pyrophosphatase MutT (NUDIX family)
LNFEPRWDRKLLGVERRKIKIHSANQIKDDHVDLIQHISEVLKSHWARIIEPGDRAQSAVALILEETPSGLNLLFIERSANENDLWSGQIGLPGGRKERGDSGPRQTAERETLEEVGLDLSGARYLGRLSDLAPGGLRIVVSCFVYLVTQRPVLHLDPEEVADAFWFPAAELYNPDRRSQIDSIFHGRLRHYPALMLIAGQKQPLWGLSYRLLRNFNRLIGGPTELNPKGRSAFNAEQRC